MPSKPRRRSWEWSKTVQAVLSHPGASCAHCGRRDRGLEVDHVRPLALGGSDDFHNLQVLCRPCHRSKTSRQRRLLMDSTPTGPERRRFHGNR